MSINPYFIRVYEGWTFHFFDFEEFELVGDRNFDDCFKYIMQDKVRLWSPQGGRGLMFTSSKEFYFLQVFIPDDRGSIAVEPMTCNVDAFNNQEGLMTLDKGSK